MAVQTVIGKVDLATDKPFRPWSLPLENFVPLCKPVEFFGNFGPEFFRVFYGFLVNAFVVLQALDVGVLAELLRAFKFALFLQYRVDIGASHRSVSFI